MKNIKEKAVYRVGIDASKNYQRKGGKKFVKKKVALLLIACMVVSSLGLTFGANASDIENHWAKETIKTWISNDFIRGYPDGSFRPNNPITRAEFMVLVNKAFGFTERAEISYKDVSEGEWYYSTVARAVAAGYIGGYTDGSMKPNHPISRQEVTVVLSKITNAPQNPSAIDNFTDASAIANWA
ncbi:S-layer homology domain-containing protein, partial [Natronincola peptidivorans]